MTGYQIIHQYEERITNPLVMMEVAIDCDEYITEIREQLVATFANEKDAVAYVARHSKWLAYGLGTPNYDSTETVCVMSTPYILLYCGRLVIRPIISDSLMFDDFDIDAKYNFSVPYNYEVEMEREFFYGDWENTEEDIAEMETEEYKNSKAFIDSLLSE